MKPCHMVARIWHILPMSKGFMEVVYGVMA